MARRFPYYTSASLLLNYRSLVLDLQDRFTVYSNRTNYKQPIGDFDKVTEMNPKYANAYYDRGLAYNKLGNRKQAIRDFDKITEPNHRDAES
jgi:tetratricopeptide (TPR) repeat protein